MVNRLPEKLVLLRKHFGFSQQELADKMGVNVVEYMGWENGRAICNLAQFKRLSTIFQISLDDMLKNTTDILLPNLGLEDSIQIPFLKNEGNESMVNIPSMNPQPTVEQKTAQIQRVKQVEERQQAKPQKAPEKPVNTIHRVDVNTQTSKNKGK
ncbi:MAG: helix-turn-helix transcriptional regulator, partial [Vagococcus sp.]